MHDEIAIPRPPDRVSVPIPSMTSIADVLLFGVAVWVAYRLKSKGVL